MLFTVLASKASPGTQIIKIIKIIDLLEYGIGWGVWSTIHCQRGCASNRLNHCSESPPKRLRRHATRSLFGKPHAGRETSLTIDLITAWEKSRGGTNANQENLKVLRRTCLQSLWLLWAVRAQLYIISAVWWMHLESTDLAFRLSDTSWFRFNRLQNVPGSLDPSTWFRIPAICQILL